MAASSTPIKIFFNEEIRRKHEEDFSSRPFIFEKSFDLKNKANFGFTPEFLAVVTKHKWESFVQQKGEIYPNLVREFFAHLVTKDSHFFYDSWHNMDCVAQGKPLSQVSGPEGSSSSSESLP
ncbi:hypothetical protein V6N12_042962 [Hibiscus sabdariffa]|uniref:Uncharacterized protein n=1 Tax=Hibiscus sabdariffa TaxID=183260 RepID=A0ABR2DJ01_9ROSI